MKASESMAKDPICGMNVDESKSIHAERNGATFYFCGEKCRTKFLAKPAKANNAQEKSGSCCG